MTTNTNISYIIMPQDATSHLAQLHTDASANSRWTVLSSMVGQMAMMPLNSFKRLPTESGVPVLITPVIMLMRDTPSDV